MQRKGFVYFSQLGVASLLCKAFNHMFMNWLFFHVFNLVHYKLMTVDFDRWQILVGHFMPLDLQF
jgi:hypothetical protein